MISENNFELVKTDLVKEIKKRGWDTNIYRQEWDTFYGWKKRGRSIIKGSKGFSVIIVYPSINKINTNRISYNFYHANATLFSIAQTKQRI